MYTHTHARTHTPFARFPETAKPFSFFKLKKNHGEFTMILPPLKGCRKTSWVFIFAHPSGSDLLYNYVTFYLLCEGIFLRNATSHSFSLRFLWCRHSNAFQTSDVEIKKEKRKMVGDAGRISAVVCSLFCSLSSISFPPTPPHFLLSPPPHYSLNLPTWECKL